LKLSKYQFIFISDDYFTQYRSELFRTESDLHGFVAFLKELNLSDFLQINVKDERKLIMHQYSNIDILLLY